MRSPEPRINPDNARFWESAHEGVLRLPRCADCAAWHWPPGPGVPRLLLRADRLGGSRSGHGTVSAWTVVHKDWFPAFKANIPYAVAQIELAEGVRLTANIVDCPADALRVGLPVEVVFDRVTDTLSRCRASARAWAGRYTEGESLERHSSSEHADDCLRIRLSLRHG